MYFYFLILINQALYHCNLRFLFQWQGIDCLDTNKDGVISENEVKDATFEQLRTFGEMVSLKEHFLMVYKGKKFSYIDIFSSNFILINNNFYNKLK